jgi:hypothetical protein
MTHSSRATSSYRGRYNECQNRLAADVPVHEQSDNTWFARVLMNLGHYWSNNAMSNQRTSYTVLKYSQRCNQRCKNMDLVLRNLIKIKGQSGIAVWLQTWLFSSRSRTQTPISIFIYRNQSGVHLLDLHFKCLLSTQRKWYFIFIYRNSLIPLCVLKS